MVTYIATFIGGGLVFTGLLLAHQCSVRRAVISEQRRARGNYNALAEENDRLRGQVHEMRRCRENNESYWKGMEMGVKKGKSVSQLEVLEGTLSGDGTRSVQIGSKKI